MKIKHLRTLSLALVLLLILPTVSAAAVGWETGISASNSNTSAFTVKADTQKSFKDQIFLLVNKERTNKHLCSLKKDATLDKMADIRAKESLTLFSHTRPNGEGPESIFKQFKITYQNAGENLAYGYKTPSELISAWMKSPEHRSNILNKNFTNVGIGFYQNSKGKIYCSLLFDKP